MKNNIRKLPNNMIDFPKQQDAEHDKYPHRMDQAEFLGRHNISNTC